jgi:hypothetical protein
LVRACAHIPIALTFGGWLRADRLFRPELISQSPRLPVSGS